MLIAEGGNLSHATFSDIWDTTRTHLQFADNLSLRSLVPAMARARNRSLPYPPSHLSELRVILEDPRYKCLCGTSQFQDSVYSGSISAEDGSVTLLFLSNRCSEFMKICPLLIGFSSLVQQGTHLYHLYTIGTDINQSVIPLAWLLMSSNTEDAYLTGFSLLRSRLVPWAFTKVICKEEVESKAYKIVFGVDVEFSLYHYIYDILSFAKSVADWQAAKNNAISMLAVKLCCGLPMLPLDFVTYGFNEIRGKISTVQGTMQTQLNQIMYYIERQWVSHAERHSVFSIYSSPERTSNASEILQDRMRRNTSSVDDLYCLVKKLVSLETASIKDINCLYRGGRPASRRTTSLSQDPEITVLSQALLHAQVSVSYSVSNLPLAVCSKNDHVLEPFIN